LISLTPSWDNPQVQSSERDDIETSSGNVFADLGLPEAEQLKTKSGLVIEITRAVRRLGLTQEEAGRRMRISQAKVSGLAAYRKTRSGGRPGL
jgi:predicted XRE-type DNA-binding protein